VEYPTSARNTQEPLYPDINMSTQRGTSPITRQQTKSRKSSATKRLETFLEDPKKSKAKEYPFSWSGLSSPDNTPSKAATSPEPFTIPSTLLFPGNQDEEEQNTLGQDLDTLEILDEVNTTVIIDDGHYFNITEDTTRDENFQDTNEQQVEDQETD
jgi:hypothetical protein